MRALDLRTATQNQVDARLALLLDDFPFFQETLVINGAFRARMNDGADLFTSSDQLWYPPAAVTRANRLNEVGEVVFYCADAVFTALLEIGASPGKVATVLRCKTRRIAADLQIIFVGVSKSKSASVDTSGYWARRQGLAERLGNGNFKKYELIDSWLTEVLSRPVPRGEEHLYRPTIAFAHLLFTSPVKALHYPSVRTDFSGLNLALPPTLADATLLPDEAWMVRFGEYADLPGHPHILPAYPVRRSKPIGSDGTIIWRPEGEALGDFGQLVATANPQRTRS